MSFLDIFRSRRSNHPAEVARERLQIIIAHERRQRDNHDPDYLMRIQQDIVQVIAKYVKIDIDQVKVQLERVGENAILELNITMPDEALLDE